MVTEVDLLVRARTQLVQSLDPCAQKQELNVQALRCWQTNTETLADPG